MGEYLGWGSSLTLLAVLGAPSVIPHVSTSVGLPPLGCAASVGPDRGLEKHLVWAVQQHAQGGLANESPKVVVFLEKS